MPLATYHRVAAAPSPSCRASGEWARSTRPGTPVSTSALPPKEMRCQPGPAFGPVDKLHQQFQQEATVRAHLYHPHLVRAADFFPGADNAYLVTDFIEGESLSERITQRGPVSEKEVPSRSRQLLRALTGEVPCQPRCGSRLQRNSRRCGQLSRAPAARRSRSDESAGTAAPAATV